MKVRKPPQPPQQSRQARYVASGRQIACVIRDPAALAALEGLQRIHGGVTAAITAALIEARHPSNNL